MTIREEFEILEKQILSPCAQLSMSSKGRIIDEPECEIRTKFQRDKDRIVYSKAFRRLKHKTQVFISPEGDHFRTRLTHTLEVSQIARTIARSLRYNEDLTEAIALGHDLGHTPFGHSGENLLNGLCPHGFRHNEQSLRVVDVLENENGLNLTWEVRDGIKNHTGESIASTLEGQIIKYADRIAYINHDIEDAMRAKIICQGDLPVECIEVLGETSSKRISNMITDIISQSKNMGTIRMSEDFQLAKDKLRKFMFDNVYIGSVAQKDEVKAQNIIKQLYNYIKKNPELLPLEATKMLKKDDLDKVVCDYIAGMTDRYAVRKFHDIFVPLSWT